MDGSRFVPNIGVPSTVTSIEIPTTIPSWAKGRDSMLYDFFPIAPTPLHTGGEYSYLFADGSMQTNTIIAGNEKTSKIFASIPGDGTVTNILTDASGVYIIHSTGSIEALDTSGKMRWQFSDHLIAGEVNAGCATLADTDLIIAGKYIGGSYFLSAINIHNGKEIPWGGTRNDPYQSVIFDAAHDIVFSVGDSVLKGNRLYGDGECVLYEVFQERFHHLELRIISNICLCGKTDGKIIDKIAFGYLSKRSGTDERTMNVGIFGIINNPTGYTLEKISSHEVPYLPVNIASNGSVVLSSGFYDSGTELTSGIDAFYSDDTIKLWQRRFTYPLAAPVAISEKFVYFTLTFSTQAQVPAQSIFYTLDLSTGKTLGELPVTGAQNGFASGIPMPMGESGFILADRNKPVMYFLKP